MATNFELVLPDLLRQVIFACETFCVAGCCGLKAFDVDAEIIHRSLQSLPKREVLHQLDALISEVQTHDGPVSSSEDLYHEWERASDCVDYLNAWRWEIARALSDQLEHTGSPKDRLVEARTHGRYAFGTEVARLQRESRKNDPAVALEVDLLVASLDENDPIIRQDVLNAQQALAERGVAPYAEAKNPPCPHCGLSLRSPLAKQCGRCGKDWH